MTKFFPLKEKQKCEWCENLSSIFVLDIQKNPTPICQMHYAFFTEPEEWNAWKDRAEGIGLRRTNYLKRESWRDK